MKQSRWNWTLLHLANQLANQLASQLIRQPCDRNSRKITMRLQGGLLLFVCFTVGFDVRNDQCQAGELVVVPDRLVVSADYPARFIVLERETSGDAQPVRDRTGSDQLQVRLPEQSGLKLMPGGVIEVVADGEQVADGQARSASCDMTILLGNESVKVPIEISQRAPESPIFPREVAAVLGKSGCNLGTCHGNLHGKSGFRLSLRGDDPAFDFNSIVRGAAGRRLDRMDTDQSLLLRKALGSTAHQGGARFSSQSRESQILKRWIEEGCEWNAITRQSPPSGLEEPRPDETLVSLTAYPAQSLLAEDCRRQQLAVIAQFGDGSVRDVTSLARFEPSVVTGVEVTADGLVEANGPVDVAISISYLSGRAASRLTFLAHATSTANAIGTQAVANSKLDELVESNLQRLQVTPQPPTDDFTFVRRVYLKTIGRLPTADEVRRFVSDREIVSDGEPSRAGDEQRSQDKAERLIDQLLSDRGYALMWSLRWSDLLRNEQKVMSDRGAEQWHAWMTEQIAADRPLDQFVSEMLTTLGSTYDHPAASFHRTHRDPETAAESIGQVFLGVRLQCARCHNHPFDKWRQDDYYGLAAYFTTLERKQLENDPKDKFDKHIISGDEIVSYKENMSAVIWHPGRSVTIEPKPLHELRIKPAAEGASADSKAGESKAGESKTDNLKTGDSKAVEAEPAADKGSNNEIRATAQPLEHLANWLTRENRMFARNMANRIWYHYMSVGIVDPPDDFRDSNPASNPELLEYLTDELIRSGYSTRHVARLILTSRAFRRASVAEPTQSEPLGGARQFGGYPLHRMPAEVLYDAISDVTGVMKTTGEKGEQLSIVRAVDRVAVPTKAGFLTTFGKPGRLLVCECERSAEVSLGQSLVLVNGLETRDKLAAKQNLIDTLLSSSAPLAELVETLYLTTLARPPASQELARFVDYVESSTSRRQALEDVLWALMNSKEFPLVR